MSHQQSGRSGDEADHTFMCDVCEEEEFEEFGTFTDVWNAAKQDGWRARKVGDDWQHVCPGCKFEYAN